MGNSFFKKIMNNNDIKYRRNNNPFIFMFISLWFSIIAYIFVYGQYLYYIKDKLSFRLYYPFFESDSPICIGIFILPLIIINLWFLVKRGFIKEKFAVILGFLYCICFCMPGILYSLPFMKSAYSVYSLTKFKHLLSHPIHTYSLFLFSLLGLFACLFLILLIAVTKKLNMLFWTIACYSYWVAFINFIHLKAFLIISILFLFFLIIQNKISCIKKYHLIFSILAFLLTYIVFKINIIFKYFVYGFPAAIGGCVSSIIFLLTFIFLKNKTETSIEKSMIFGIIFCFINCIFIGLPLKSIILLFFILIFILYLLRLLLSSEKDLSQSDIKYINKFFIAGAVFFFPFFSLLLYYFPESIVHNSEVEIIAEIDHPHSILLKQNGEQALFTGDLELYWHNYKKNSHKIIRTQDFIQESQHAAMGLDENRLYLVPRTYDSILCIDLKRSFENINFFRPINLSFPRNNFFYGTSWPLVTNDTIIIVSENGFIVKCPFNKNIECECLHFSYSASGKTLIESIGGEKKSYIKTDAVILNPCLNKLYVVINDSPFGVLVFDPSSLKLLNHILKNHEIENLMLYNDSFYCSIPKQGKIAVINIRNDKIVKWAEAFIGINNLVYASINDCYYATSFKSPYVYESKSLNCPFKKKWRVSRIIKNMKFNPANNSLLIVGRDSNKIFQIDLNNL